MDGRRQSSLHYHLFDEAVSKRLTGRTSSKYTALMDTTIKLGQITDTTLIGTMTSTVEYLYTTTTSFSSSSLPLHPNTHTHTHRYDRTHHTQKRQDYMHASRLRTTTARPLARLAFASQSMLGSNGQSS